MQHVRRVRFDRTDSLALFFGVVSGVLIKGALLIPLALVVLIACCLAVAIRRQSRENQYIAFAFLATILLLIVAANTAPVIVLGG